MHLILITAVFVQPCESSTSLPGNLRGQSGQKWFPENSSSHDENRSGEQDAMNLTADAALSFGEQDAINFTADAALSVGGQKRIYIFRHAERGHGGFAHLNECGWDRAWNLQSFPGLVAHPPQKIFAFNYELSKWRGSAERTAQTAFWVANKYKHSIYRLCNGDPACNGKTGDDWGTCQMMKQDYAMAKLLNEQIKHYDTIAVFWEHWNIKFLVKFLTNLDLHKIMGEWKETDFETVLDVHCSSENCHNAPIDAKQKSWTDHKKPSTSCAMCKSDNSRRRGCHGRAPDHDISIEACWR